MENKKTLSFPFIIIAIILGVVLFKQFDFQTLRFDKPALAIVYLIGFVISVYVLLKNSRKKS
jgi:hypothetical protein